MHKVRRRYKAKHLAEKTKRNSSLSKLLIVAIMLCIFALESMSGILSYMKSKVSVVNTLSIAGQYTVHFDANGGVGSMLNQRIYIGQSVNLYANTFSMDDYVFTGWNTSQDGTGTAYADKASVYNLSITDGSVINLYAQWEEETYVAELVGDKKYQTIQEAINAVSADNQKRTIKLLKDVELTTMLTVQRNKNIEFDLQEHEISNAANANINIIKVHGTLEIIGGTIQSSVAFGAIDIENSGSLTVNGSRIITTGARQAIYNNGGNVEITGNAYLSSSASDRATVQNNKPGNGNAGTITISGGTIVSTTTSSKGAVENATTGTVIITGGTIISENCIGVDNKGDLVIGVGDLNMDVTLPVIQGATYGVSTTSSATVDFYDGIVKGKTDSFNDIQYITNLEQAHEIEESTEVIDGDTYKTAYLVTTKVKVTFDANDGTGSESIVYVDYGQEVGTLPTVTRTHYQFNGWFTDSTAGRQITASEIVAGNITFYAHWTQVEAEVIFDAMGGTATQDSVIANVGAQLGSLPTATKQYRAFVGWFTDPVDGIQINGTETITQDVTYYAHWNFVDIVVSFDGNLGTSSESTRHVNAGEEVGSLPSATRANYEFMGWYTEPTGGRKIKASEIITETVTFYAHWSNSCVARIGTEKYESLQDAIRDVPTDNTETTIYILKDILEAVEVIPNQNIVVNLQGFTLRNDGTKKINSIIGTDARAVVIENSGTLRLTNGSISASTAQSAINNNENLVVDNVTITQTGTRQAIYNNGGNLEITGGSYLSATSSDRATVQGNKPASKTNAGTITITSGTIVSTNTTTKGAIENPSTGTVIITGGTVISNRSMAIDNKGTLILGKQDGVAGNTTPVVQGASNGVKNSGTVVVFNFYDGIVKGISSSINGLVSDYEIGATRVDSTETIGTNTYNTTYYQQ